jgi:hypothetical protein
MDLSFEVGGAPDAIDQEVQKPFGWESALDLEFFQCLLADGQIGAPYVKHHIVVSVSPEALEP